MSKPVYTPVIRYRQEEKKVLTSFDFGDKIYPYIEIFKKLERVHTSKKKSEPTFHEVHLPILRDIKSNKVFVDLPVHLKTSTKMKKEVVEFLTQVIGNRQARTAHLIGLKSLNNKIIPVISTYSQRTGEPNSIIGQENDLRPVFNSLGFRTSSSTFDNDMKQIIKVATADDYLFVDLEEYCLASDDDIYAIDFMLHFIKSFTLCPVIILNSSIHHSTTNAGLDHGKRIDKADNSLQYSFKSYGAKGFGDYAGLKKDVLEGGGRISPGFIFYDAVENSYYGYKGNKKGELEDFLDIIIPAVLKSDGANRMLKSTERYLDSLNPGWKLINEMSTGIENPRSQSKFKRISMLHYLYCIKKKVQMGIV
ncbi:beta family protein [Sphingobacterium faecium]|uniref:beta family protein n=1 Tax=Sphingobacterium faecium TaxID=34087 RepID=UPI003DA22AF1